MFEIGNSLRAARIRQKLELSQAEGDTRIRAKYLRALEDERFELLPGSAYAKGFLRAYADYLGLDGQLEPRAAIADGLHAHAEQLGERPRRARTGHYLKFGSICASIRYGPPLASARPIAAPTSPGFSTRSPGTPSERASST